MMKRWDGATQAGQRQTIVHLKQTKPRERHFHLQFKAVAETRNALEISQDQNRKVY
jgi:hypothetical protein